MGNRIVLMGGGGHCKSVLDALLRNHIYEEIVITDPSMPEGSKILGVEVAGSDDKLEELKKKGFTDAFVTVGSIEVSEIRWKLYHKAKTLGFHIPTIIDATAAVSDAATVGEGSFIGKNAVVNAEASIGRMAIINTGAIVEHECVVGDFSHISVGAVLCGNVRVGENSFVGANATVRQGVKIGDQTMIGAGSIVLQNIKDKETRYGIIKSGGGTTKVL